MTNTIIFTDSVDFFNTKFDNQVPTRDKEWFFTTETLSSLNIYTQFVYFCKAMIYYQGTVGPLTYSLPNNVRPTALSAFQSSAAARVRSITRDLWVVPFVQTNLTTKNTVRDKRFGYGIKNNSQR